MTTETKWTPGPWAVSEVDEFGGYDMMTAGVRVGPVTLDAKGYGQGQFANVLEDDVKQRMLADAHLIAAAPELYEALNSMLWDLEILMGESLGVYGLHLNGDAAPWGELTPGGRFARLDSIIEASAALAKARGDA